LNLRTARFPQPRPPCVVCSGAGPPGRPRSPSAQLAACSPRGCLPRPRSRSAICSAIRKLSYVTRHCRSAPPVTPELGDRTHSTRPQWDAQASNASSPHAPAVSTASARPTASRSASSYDHAAVCSNRDATRNGSRGTVRPGGHFPPRPGQPLPCQHHAALREGRRSVPCATIRTTCDSRNRVAPSTFTRSRNPCSAKRSAVRAEHPSRRAVSGRGINRSGTAPRK
jgi:hypothetical protein